jgi:hypothetical protein
MTRKQLGPYIMPLAYAVAGAIVIIGIIKIVVVTGITTLYEAALEINE